MTLVEQPLAEILAALGKRSPEIGGSTASILSALIGLAMTKMAVVISRERKPDNVILASTETWIEVMSLDLSLAADRDRQLFQTYMEGLRNRNADRGKQPLKCEVQQAEADATNEPLAASGLIVDALEKLQVASPVISHLVASDFHAGAAILGAAFVGTITAVEVNLEAERMTTLRAKTANDRARLISRCNVASAALKRFAALHRLHY